MKYTGDFATSQPTMLPLFDSKSCTNFGRNRISYSRSNSDRSSECQSKPVCEFRISRNRPKKQDALKTPRRNKGESEDLYQENRQPANDDTENRRPFQLIDPIKMPDTELDFDVDFEDILQENNRHL